MLKSPSSKLQIKASALYEPLWLSPKRYIISIGGRGGARSYENSQNIVGKLKQTKRKFRAAIMRAVHTDIRHSIWQECVDRVEEYEQEYLDDLDYPDDIKTAIKNVAKVNNLRYRQAEKDPYIKHLIEQAVAAGKIVEASPSRTPRTTPAQKQGDIPKFDMSTAEGRKEFETWKKNKDANK